MMNTGRIAERLHCPEPQPARRGTQQEIPSAVASADWLFLPAIADHLTPCDPLTEEAPPAPDWQPLQQALHDRITASAGADCAFTLLLPQAGTVDVTLAARQPTGWDIALRFPPQVWQQWQRRAGLCRQHLSQSLAAPVELKIEQGLA